MLPLPSSRIRLLRKERRTPAVLLAPASLATRNLESELATTSAPDIDAFLRDLLRWSEVAKYLGVALDLVRRTASQIPEITEVYRTRVGQSPTFIFVTSNEKYSKELEKKILEIDREIVATLPDFKFDILCFPKMGRRKDDIAPNAQETIYQREGQLHALP